MGSYFFEKQQLLKVFLLKDGNEIGVISVSLGAIVGSVGSVYRGVIKNNITLKISAQGISEDASYLTCKLEAEHISLSDNFVKPEDKISYI